MWLPWAPVVRTDWLQGSVLYSEQEYVGMWETAEKDKNGRQWLCEAEEKDSGQIPAYRFSNYVDGFIRNSET